MCWLSAVTFVIIIAEGLHDGRGEHGVALHRIPFPRLPGAAVPHAQGQVGVGTGSGTF